MLNSPFKDMFHQFVLSDRNTKTCGQHFRGKKKKIKFNYILRTNSDKYFNYYLFVTKRDLALF